MGHARLVLALAIATLLPVVAAAQGPTSPWADPQDAPARVDVSGSAGFLMPTGWSSLVLIGTISSATGALEQVLTRDLRVEPNAAFNAAVTYWRGRYGFRTQAGMSRSTLTVGGTPQSGGLAPSNGAASVDIDTWLYDVRGAVGFIDYNRGRRVFPYGFFGFGGITYDLKTNVGPPLTFITQPPPTTAPPNTVIVRDTSRDFLIAVDELGIETVFALNIGVGTDFRVPVGPGGLGLRLELSDHIAPSPLGLRVRELSPFGGLAGDSAVRFGMVHHLGATAGFVINIGR